MLLQEATMLKLLLFALPLALTLVSLFIKRKTLLDIIVLIHSLFQLYFSGMMLFQRADGLDKLSLFSFVITALIYFAIALYRLAEPFDNKLNYRLYTIFLMLFVLSMDAAFLAKDLGLAWILVEATTIFSALLISIKNQKSTLEAAWKYLFICSLGIALAFVGILLFVLAQPEQSTLVFSQIDAGLLSPFWLKLSFVFILIGFGTKIGLAPMHFWLPDAYSEAPSPISALLSGALMNAALIPILRLEKIMQMAGLAALSSELFLIVGFLSVFIATAYILKTDDYKRLLAYSSIENKGLIFIALGLSGNLFYTAFLHLFGHSMLKAALFLTSGNIQKTYHSRRIDKVKGLISLDKRSGWLWLFGLVMLLGFPPSPLFISKFFIFVRLYERGLYLPLIFLAIMLSSIAWAILKQALEMNGRLDDNEKLRHPILCYLAPAMLILIALLSAFKLPVFG